MRLRSRAGCSLANRSGFRGLHPHQVAHSAALARGLAPAAVSARVLFAERQRDAQALRQPVRHRFLADLANAVLDEADEFLVAPFPRLQADRPVVVLGRPERAFDDLLLREHVARHGRVRLADAAVAAVEAADIGEFDDAAVVHLVADQPARQVEGRQPESLAFGGVGKPEQIDDVGVRKGFLPQHAFEARSRPGGGASRKSGIAPQGSEAPPRAEHVAQPACPQPSEDGAGALLSMTIVSGDCAVIRVTRPPANCASRTCRRGTLRGRARATSRERPARPRSPGRNWSSERPAVRRGRAGDSMCLRVTMQAPHWMTSLYCETSSGKCFPPLKSTPSSPPANWRSQRGIFTRPMSSQSGRACRLPPPARGRPAAGRACTAAPSARRTRSAFSRAIRIEKVVSGMSRGRVGGRLEHDLGIADHQRGRLPGCSRARRSSRSFTTTHDGVGVEHLADRLHLRQDQPALRRAEVDRDDQHDEPAGAEPGRRRAAARAPGPPARGGSAASRRPSRLRPVLTETATASPRRRRARAPPRAKARRGRTC